MSLVRRGFLRNGLVAAAALVGGRRVAEAGAASLPQGSGAEARLKELGIELPQAPAPIATYVPAVQVGELLFVSGTGPRSADGFLTGKVGTDLTIEQGYDAARQVGLNVLSIVRATLGSLDDVARVAKVHGMVNALPQFTQQPEVINGFSDLMVEVFGEDAGKARAPRWGWARFLETSVSRSSRSSSSAVEDRRDPEPGPSSGARGSRAPPRSLCERRGVEPRDGGSLPRRSRGDVDPPIASAAEAPDRLRVLSHRPPVPLVARRPRGRGTRACPLYRRRVARARLGLHRRLVRRVARCGKARAVLGDRVRPERARAHAPGPEPGVAADRGVAPGTRPHVETARRARSLELAPLRTRALGDRRKRLLGRVPRRRRRDERGLRAHPPARETRPAAGAFFARAGRPI